MPRQGRASRSEATGQGDWARASASLPHPPVFFWSLPLAKPSPKLSLSKAEKGRGTSGTISPVLLHLENGPKPPPPAKFSTHKRHHRRPTTTPSVSGTRGAPLYAVGEHRGSRE